MLALHPKFITDNDGKRTAVILSLEEYESILSALEDMEDFRLYDEAKSNEEESYTVEEAFKQIEKQRKQS